MHTVRAMQKVVMLLHVILAYRLRQCDAVSRRAVRGWDETGALHWHRQPFEER